MPPLISKRAPRSHFARCALATMLLACSAGATMAAKQSRPLIDLDASSLPAGSAVRSWPNTGSLGGEFTTEGKTAPVVANVGGRAAVTFDVGRFLASSFKSPAQIAGGHPFTLIVWAYIVVPSPRNVMVSWASRPIHSAEFAYAAGPDGAFFGWDKSDRYLQMPPAGKWHQLAFTYDGDEFRIYVDGVADLHRPMKLTIRPASTMRLGAGWDGVRQKAIFPFKGSLAKVQVWDRAFSPQQVRNAAGFYEPFDPIPADGSIVPIEGVRLNWKPGDARAKSYALDFSSDAPPTGAYPSAARPLTAPQFQPAALTPGRTYTWRVDQIDADGKVLGKSPVWRFTVDNGPATAPFPRDRVAGVAQDTKSLTWTPGRYVHSQTVFFGPDRDAVASGAAIVGKGLDPKAGELAIPLHSLNPGVTYYWRVEENNGSLPAAKGNIWAFRTDDAPIKNDVTFFVGSDCHYGFSNNVELNHRVIAEMNWLPGEPLPAKAGGGIVRTPRGLVLNGDLLDKGYDPKTAPALWAEFVRDYGLTGLDGSLGYPLYEGFGNHDGPTRSSISRAGIKLRNRSRIGLTAVSSNGYHYSWDWDQVHLVQLNLFPGRDSADCTVSPPNHDPENALGFLKEDLAQHVLDRSRVVVIFCHYCYSGGMADWWTQAAKERFRDAIKGYRVILIHGHSHGAYFYKWQGLRVISDGSTAKPDGQNGDFMVVHITPTNLCVAERHLSAWGITLDEPLPATDRAKADAEAVAQGAAN